MPVNQRQWNSTMPQRKAPMRRTGFKARSFATQRPTVRPGQSVAGYSKTVSSKPTSKPKCKTLGAGKKTRRWDGVRARLKPLFESAGITRCELWLNGCLRDNFLGFAHSLKRRNIKTDSEMEEVCLACASCHDAIEVLGEKKMYPIVKRTIAARTTPVKRLFDLIEHTENKC